ncbi:outer membrane beta-barrel protein [Flavobacterium sp. NST-5]|uniref:Outer membrane beta-barrel protein n=1 Tax=Flavobacterium ichthyis TaxID=2698827 RepID=A0ABW9Z7D6_9FLAO|nr:porin family protein [Flavobacterium ichthyis]NBL64477.1 outer membrane beta-barrel protein [Flavobacterium ichthyis]
MKKLIFTLAAVAAFMGAKAQETVEGGFAKGDMFISGSFGVESSKTGDEKSTGFEVAPSFGVFVSPNIAIGGRLGFVSEKEEDATDELTTSALSIGAFGRYYFTPASKFSVFGELAVEYVTANVDNGIVDVDANGFGVQLAPGISYFIAKNFAIEASWGVLNYNTAKPDIDGAESTNNFEFGLNMRDINFGLIYKF